MQVNSYFFHSLWPSDAIWQVESGSILAQVMACCLVAPSHYLKQCRLLICKVLWHSTESNFAMSAQAMILYNEFGNYTFKIIATSHRGQWVEKLSIVRVNSLWPGDAIWRHRSVSTLVQVMACCLMAPSHYLNQYWLIKSRNEWHSFEVNYTRITSATNH